eukprot:CAMPEP_0204915286 /NCGR_PEP_ID=MMETSP1397-20131031/13316_1 /ASSEMBLY_ACC=CAM_ASM_000891 /TAXON_ID=49980 /ORGANISM="Climacostomum Climacostomum virens, Strain Stock W-24" /LENGTH=184 /DNA_ID=CAMNT_0052087255 /DNA_START=39 /DNA_END=593 /DNA_ORIENTATION=-
MSNEMLSVLLINRITRITTDSFKISTVHLFPLQNAEECAALLLSFIGLTKRLYLKFSGSIVNQKLQDIGSLIKQQSIPIPRDIESISVSVSDSSQEAQDKNAILRSSGSIVQDDHSFSPFEVLRLSHSVLLEPNSPRESSYILTKRKSEFFKIQDEEDETSSDKPDNESVTTYLLPIKPRKAGT